MLIATYTKWKAFLHAYTEKVRHGKIKRHSHILSECMYQWSPQKEFLQKNQHPLTIFSLIFLQH
jgi:hypothetical protein